MTLLSVEASAPPMSPLPPPALGEAGGGGRKADVDEDMDSDSATEVAGSWREAEGDRWRYASPPPLLPPVPAADAVTEEGGQYGPPKAAEGGPRASFAAEADMDPPLPTPTLERGGAREEEEEALLGLETVGLRHGRGDSGACVQTE